MRLLTFSVLRNCKFKPWCYQLRNFSDQECGLKEQQMQVVTEKDSLEGCDPIEVSSSWEKDMDKELRDKAIHSMQVFPNFISEVEEQRLMIEVEPILKRMRYEYDHWDNAIEGYRETERSQWSEANEAVIARMKAAAHPPVGTKWLKNIHVLDLAAAGYIRPHVDAVRFCGDIIVGLCLLSSAVMRLRNTSRPAFVFDAFLPQRGIYIMSGVSRYEFEHEVLPMKTSSFRGVPVPRKRRVALIARTEPKKENTV